RREYGPGGDRDRAVLIRSSTRRTAAGRGSRAAHASRRQDARSLFPCRFCLIAAHQRLAFSTQPLLFGPLPFGTACPIPAQFARNTTPLTTTCHRQSRRALWHIHLQLLYS